MGFCLRCFPFSEGAKTAKEVCEEFSDTDCLRFTRGVCVCVGGGMVKHYVDTMVE